MEDLSNFQTFRKQPDSEQCVAQMQQLISRLQNELRATHERQESLRRANDQLTRIIVRHNNQHQERSERFIRYVDNLCCNGEKYEGRSVKAQNLVSHNSSSLKPRRSTQKHVRIRTQISDENDFLAMNCNRSTITRKDVKEKLSKIQGKQKKH